MSHLPPGMTVQLILRASETTPDLPGLKDAAIFNHGAGRYHPDTKTEIRIALDKIDPERLIRVLEDSEIRVSRCFLTPFYDQSQFWKGRPEDCVGAVLSADGFAKTYERGTSHRAIPLDQPLYIKGRPELDIEHRSREKPHVLQEAGTTIVSDELLSTLRKLGAVGETATLIYRGSKKSSYDTVQPGFQRFRPQPEYEMPAQQLNGFNFLPESLPEDFGICGMLRTRGLDRWYEIALSRVPFEELRRLRRSLLFDPIFRFGGETFQWFTRFEAVLNRLQSR